jgi:hypothetical protein
MVMVNARTETPVGAESCIATTMGVPLLGVVVLPEQPADKTHRIHKTMTPKVDVLIFL